VGVLSLYAPGAGAFTEDQGRLIQMLASQVAQAIELVDRTAGEPPVRATRDLKLVATRG
jgi:GAF domain-containing protein